MQVKMPTPAERSSYTTIRDVGHTTRRACFSLRLNTKSSKILVNEGARLSADRKTKIRKFPYLPHPDTIILPWYAKNPIQRAEKQVFTNSRAREGHRPGAGLSSFPHHPGAGIFQPLPVSSERRDTPKYCSALSGRRPVLKYCR